MKVIAARMSGGKRVCEPFVRHYCSYWEGTFVWQFSRRKFHWNQQISTITSKSYVILRIYVNSYHLDLLPLLIRVIQIFNHKCNTFWVFSFISCLSFTVWKFHDFSVTQILREINFGESRSSENAVFAIHWAQNLVNFSLQKVQKFINI